MSTVVTWQIKSTNSEQTEQIAEQIGSALRGGEVIELISDLGGGKTTFTRGLARGFGSTDRVASPTFTISKVYKDNKGREMHHFDFYRLPEAGLIAAELADVLGDPSVIIVVEWAGIVQDVLPQERLTITLEKTPEDQRIISLSASQSLAYLVEEAQK